MLVPTLWTTPDGALAAKMGQIDQLPISLIPTHKHSVALVEWEAAVEEVDQTFAKCELIVAQSQRARVAA